VHAGPKVIDFGKIFKKSRVDRYFYIRNELKTAIEARLVNPEAPFNESYQEK
jgi:hypothetical protein